MGDVSWEMKLYDRSGNAINANYSGYSDLGVTNVIGHATDRRLNFYLNAVDELEFALYLDDPMALNIQRLTRFVKVWRTVPGYTDGSNTPAFAGIVGNHQKDGESNLMRVKCFSPFWRLQSRFHLLNHYLKKNPATGNDYTQSELIWKLIDLINNAFGLSVSFTGIEQGTFYDSGSEISVAPYFQPKGANTWVEIFEGILLRPGSVDLIPRYHHTGGNPRLMYLDTALKRGTDKSGSVTFSYRTATPSNCTNMTEEELVEPGELANYVWAVGAGGPNSGKVAVSQDNGAIGEGYNAIGIYMRRVNKPDIKRIGILGANPPKTATHLKAIALAELARSIIPKTTHAVSLSPTANIYYAKNFSIGDVVNLDGEKGALIVGNEKKRIYRCTLSISDNNMETAAPLVADDFFGKVAP